MIGMDKPIILIGGAAGTGKSSLANQLSCALDLDHRLGTGFVRSVIQSQTTPAKDPLLFSRTYQSETPIEHIRWQSKRLKPAVMVCIKRARAEGTSLVIEGSHLLPELYSDIGATLFLVLDAGDMTRHHTRITGHRHTKRLITDSEFASVRLTNDYFLKTATKHNVKIIDYDQNLEEITDLIRAGV